MLRVNRQVNFLVLNAFYPAPEGAEQERTHCLCPVRAVTEYVDRTRDLRTTNRLMKPMVGVPWGGLCPNSAVRAGWWTVSPGLITRQVLSFPGSGHTALGRLLLVWHV